ncbi:MULTISPECIES: alpha/beta fold hydrolase [unclassified Acidovorax]|uniref:alpha/beta fold hydrolase n=1 Tax=unclassified Acidovorax TaxID=2684926 RepID=UPI0037CAA275
MQEQEFQVLCKGRALHGTAFHGISPQPPRTLALHGGGRSSRQGYRPLLTYLAGQDQSAAAFDFAGQGDSPGPMSDSSLDDRVAQALAVVERLGLQPPVSLIASSMGGHIACSLIPRLMPAAIVLFCPAAYEAAAQPVAFGPAFQQVIRTTTAFAASPAFSALEQFEGRLLLVLGEHDAVIPREVEHGYITRATRARSVEVIRLAGSGHALHAWLQDHPADRGHVFARVLATLRG